MYNNLIDEVISTTSKATLEQWYLNEKLSTRAIAGKLSVSQPTARKILSFFGIQTRSYKDNKTPVPKGSKMRESHKQAISVSLMGNTNNVGNNTAERKIVKCQHCNKEYTQRAKYLNKVKHYFCSSKCSNKWRSTLIQEKHPRFKSTKLNCNQCQKELIIAPCRENNKYGIFCSHKCFSLWRSFNITGAKIYNYKGGHDEDYGPTWSGSKKFVRIRDNNTCQKCGVTKSQYGKNMDVHHITPFRSFHESIPYFIRNLPSNLICYCNRCHKIVEEDLNKKMRQITFNSVNI